ncbi:hypothetical protein ABFS82_09G023700 [Erythranthe guttata]|uniref:UDP-glycosyltransferase 90A1-like n=1 Tax=Erythranthe guttata TaxID=4155 RepID=UPI00064D8993|nr:PREDICTED: UDP-glycosyltransferase 90A1-like [Erythranthe guttata]|eukprot:XP_012831198.1 PREDICTED: UDP-glycosyltransferase 90A1-like [Erythranthe guttata]
MAASPLPRIPHFVIFPFMAQGHTIPLIYLARLLRRRSAAITIFTTAANSPPIRATLRGVDGVSVVELPFPENIDGVPPGVENVDKLPSLSSFFPFVKSTKLMQNSFEQALETLDPPVSCIVSDVFLDWTLRSARRFGVPRLCFYVTGQFSFTMYQIFLRERPHAAVDSLDEPFPVPGFPHLTLTRNDSEPPFNDTEPSAGPFMAMVFEHMESVRMSQGVVVNSFYEMEKRYVDHWNENIGPKAYCLGPLCLAAAAAPPPLPEKPGYIRFLDEKLELGEPVLYVAFGSQGELSKEQFEEIAKGLEQSEVSFLWVLRTAAAAANSGLDLEEFDSVEFEERVRGRGVVVKEWVDQVRVLRHGGVGGFLSHAGWNSFMESICGGVPVIAMPFVADQHLNARFVVEEAGAGLRVWPRGGSVRGLVMAEEVERKVRELMMGGEEGAEVRRKVAEYRDAAWHAMEEGGSSMLTLDLLIHEMGTIEIAKT